MIMDTQQVHLYNVQYIRDPHWFSLQVLNRAGIPDDIQTHALAKL